MKILIFPSPEPPEQEIARWKKRAQEKEEEKERLELNAGMEQVLKENLSQLMSMAETCGRPSPYLMSSEIT